MKKFIATMIQLLFVVLLSSPCFATLTLSFQKISSLYGEFTASISDNTYYGQSVANLGDINNDGIVDVASSNHYSSDGGSQRGAIFVQFLDNNGKVLSFQKISSATGQFTASFSNGDYFGRSIGGIEDVNGDDLNDLVVSMQNPGHFFVIFLLTDGTVQSFQKIWTGTGGFTATVLSADCLGVSFTSVGDLNNDGVPDLAAGAMKDSTGDYLAGRAITPQHHNTSRSSLE